MNFSFNTGLGPVGCNGQGPANCVRHSSGCCYGGQYGPALSQYLSPPQNSTFTPMSLSQSVKWIQAQRNPVNLSAKMSQPINNKQKGMVGVI